MANLIIQLALYNDIIKQNIVGAILSLEVMQRVEKLSPNAIKNIKCNAK
jgi:DNA integrity scanning protein DisA with diadenylate cyclase activity